ncbi:MAG: hypothetical protein Unbinned3891contig1000_83 [Prokaryotic dsDNA virus sp.]|mgnify:CR=1 FL=1|nr:MAG: hypothetical protein Unbinned3891contig1000_83 [Prokaryotic dsDNA virus sp.]|tara:strand:- start:44148 stop:44840 length:693 start_codon:yes stop_codon:yes gene_type:complete
MNGYWTPDNRWAGEDVYLIGGGSSLASFDFSVLEGRNTIGVNAAFKLGPTISKFCIFGDTSFFHRLKHELQAYTQQGGELVGVSPSLSNINLPWLHKMQRIRDGLHRGHVLGWNYSTGAAAINLAASLGARRIFLLGYDLSPGVGGRTHWHRVHPRRTPEDSFKRFGRGFRLLAGELRAHSDIEVINVTDGSSKLTVFRCMDFPEFESILHGHHQQNAQADSGLLAQNHG